MGLQGLSAEQLRAAVPDTTGELQLEGLSSPVTVYRDSLGVAHIRARTDADAFFAQGYVQAQDRLWHMDYDRHRAYGRWAEWVGAVALPQDRLLRAMRLLDNAKADYATVAPETRAMLDAFAAGVNTFIASAKQLPVEYSILGTAPEPWQPWDGLAVFKVRHVTMGVWEAKLWRGLVLRQVGPETLAALYGVGLADQLRILPPGTFGDAGYVAPIAELAALLPHLAALSEEGAGSNSWALAPGRTATGKPLVAGDPHRAPDVPNVYYQNHLAGATFDVIGLAFPGLPGFPHFGHNSHVSWCVTHAMADTQDLFIEQFDPANPRRYRFRDEWREADVRRETIRVRGEAPVEVDVVSTHHGPVVAGDPARGHALAMRYVALLPGNHGWDCLLPMLRAENVRELGEAMRGWVDPANNFLMADVDGNIAYRTRGQVPVRSEINAWLPVPGWTGEHEWSAVIPFEAMPAQTNPPAGYIITANNRIVGPEYPHYISHWYAADHRARRIHAHLSPEKRYAAQDLVAIHQDVVSIPAHALRDVFAALPAGSRFARAALALLVAWNGELKADQPGALVFEALREELVAGVLRRLLGPLAERPYTVVGNGPPSIVARLRQRIHEYVVAGDSTLLASGTTWTDELAAALERAVEKLRAELGDDPSTWRWGMVHQLRPSHPLCLAQPELGRWLNPPVAEMGGDGDTVQAAWFQPATGFTVTTTSVARYLFDLADWDRSGWIVPYGVSGHPGSPHYADQAPDWRAHRLQPMPYTWARVESVAVARQTLFPRSRK